MIPQIKRKILFIGDLRTGLNYGAIATTETLISFLNDYLENYEIKYVDYKSLYHPTPINGWEKSQIKKNVFRIIIKKILPAKIIKIIKEARRKKYFQHVDYIPYKYDLYEKYYIKMLNGSILQYEKKMLEWADIIVVNGEGNIVNGTDEYGKYRKGGLYILFLAWLSKVKYNKTTYIINHTVDPANNDVNEIINNLYPVLDLVYVRETLSIDKLKKLGVNNATFVPDALFGYIPKEGWTPSEELLKQIDFSKPYICIGDSSGIKNRYNQVKWDVTDFYSQLINELKKITPQIIFVDGFNNNNKDINKVIEKMNIGYVRLKNCTYHDLYYVLKKAEIFVSGRWHASILSVLAGTPILLFGSDSHKTRSLYTLLDYPYPFYETSTLPIHIDDIAESVKKILNEKEKVKILIKDKLSQLSPRARENISFINNI